MNRSHLIGFGGAAETGKSTAAEMLIEAAQPQSHEHIEFSAPILEAAQFWLGRTALNSTINESDCTAALDDTPHTITGTRPVSRDISNLDPLDKQYLNKLAERQISHLLSAETKNIHRPLLEWLGRSAIQLISPNIWGDAVRAKIRKAKEQSSSLITVGGVRTIADRQVLKDEEGIVIRLHRHTRLILPSEYQINQWEADFDIQNEGTLDELRDRIGRLWRELQETAANQAA